MEKNQKFYYLKKSLVNYHIRNLGNQMFIVTWTEQMNHILVGSTVLSMIFIMPNFQHIIDATPVNQENQVQNISQMNF